MAWKSMHEYLNEISKREARELDRRKLSTRASRDPERAVLAGRRGRNDDRRRAWP